MKKALCISLLMLSTLCSIGLQAKTAQPLDQIVAIINDDVITASEFQRALAQAKRQWGQQPNAPTEAELEKRVLNQLVDKKLQLQIVKQAGITITDAELNKIINRIAEQNNMSLTTFYERVNQEGIKTADYRTEMRDQLAVQKLQQQELARHITVSDAEVTKFMRDKPWRKDGPKEYHLEDILIPLTEAPSPADVAKAQKEAQTILSSLHKGEDLKTVIQNELKNYPALTTEDLGWRPLSEIPSAFANQVAQMQAKDIHGPIQAPNGLHIIRVADARTLGVQTVAPTRQQVEQILFQRKFEEAVQVWVSKLRGQAFIVTNPK